MKVTMHESMDNGSYPRELMHGENGIHIAIAVR